MTGKICPNPYVVLIDTWWNVNLTSLSGVTDRCPGFNRYMVECEYEYISQFLKGEGCFNRYMVECESGEQDYKWLGQMPF